MNSGHLRAPENNFSYQRPAVATANLSMDAANFVSKNQAFLFSSSNVSPSPPEHEFPLKLQPKQQMQLYLPQLLSWLKMYWIYQYKL